MKSFDPTPLANPAVLQLKPYIPGKPSSECQREFGLMDIVKLASNENSLGTSRYVMDNLAAEFVNISQYPDGSSFALKEALSAHLHVAPEQLLLGNGSEEVLRMIMQTFVWDDHH